jgi:DNA modification methylase
LAATKENDFVLDPFNGSGTTGLVSLNLQRNYLGLEISRKYADLAKKRMKDEPRTANVKCFSSITTEKLQEIMLRSQS